MPSPIKTFNELKKNIKKNVNQYPAVKIAILGDSSTQFLAQAIKGYGWEVSLNFDVFEADYDQMEMQILDISSEFHKYKPEYVILFLSVQKLLKKFAKTNQSERKNFYKVILEDIKNLVNAINNFQNCKIICFNFPEITDAVFGNYSNKLGSSFIYNLRKINLSLMDLSREIKNFYINDICLLQSHYGFNCIHDSKIYINGDIDYNLEFTALIAKNITDIILSLTGKSKKCLIFDLDNTLWGGIIGDDGIENIQIGELGIGKAFSELQLWAKQLKERGIILAVCSKNDYEIAKEPFENHPDMVLSMEDFAVFISNWNNKADNINEIQSILNIGLDTMVFLDDNPFERNLVRNFLPEVNVPELPEDPADYLNYLKSLNLFETSSFSEEDNDRTELYRQEHKRTVLKQAFANEDEYLASLSMVSECKSFDKFSIPRVAQLTQRSNQFNLRTVRYTENDIQLITDSKEYLTQSFTLEDKFGNYGMISLIIMKKNVNELFLDTWIMSCRVLKRTMENFVLNTIAGHAKENGFTVLTGEYIPTPKNNMVKDLYKNFGFSETAGFWKLDLNNFNQRKTLIIKK